MKSNKKFRVTRRHTDGDWVPDMERRYAALDIGSNGVRLLLSKVIISGEYCVFTKESLIRMPIRLGADVFKYAYISRELEEQLVSSMTGFSYLLNAYAPADYRACATSAMREAENGIQIVDRVYKESGLHLEIIDGGEEAEIIFASHIAETLDSDHAYLYIDVGGGSTELTLFAENRKIASRSFPIGTVRMLNEQVDKATWKEMKHWVRERVPEDRKVRAIGSGGNMNKIFRLAGKANNEPIKFKELIAIDDLLNSYSLEERIRIMHLRPDRSDVIIPASKIFRSIMKWGRIKRIYVPQFGLADGLVHIMHDKFIAERRA